jgi:uncharacterized protein (TIGR03437 family)
MKPIVAFLLMVAPGVVRAQSYSFTRFDVPGAAHTRAEAINNRGQILGWYLDAAGASHCFLRDAASTFTTFDPPGAGATCRGLNNLGQVVGTLNDSRGFHGYIRDAAGQFTLFDIPMRGPGAAVAAINDRGEIVGTFAAPPYGGPGFLRTPDGAFTDLAAHWIGQLDPACINNRGEIGGWALYGSSYGTQHGFLRSVDGTYRKFDLPGTTTHTRIAAIDDTGRFAGAMVGGLGFVANADGTFTLFPGYPVTGIDDAGRIVGFHFDAGVTHAFIGVPGPSSTAPEIRTELPGVLPASAFGGSSQNRTIAPGTWIEIYGRNLAPVTRQWTASDFRNGVAPTSLDGVRVTIGGFPAFVSYVSPGQVNALVPSSVSPGRAQVAITIGSQSTVPYDVEVAASRPAMLTLPPQLSPESAYVAALFPDLATYAVPPHSVPAGVPARRAKAGDTLVLFGMGFGVVSPDVQVGRIANGPASVVSKVEIGFRGAAAPVFGKVTYAGLVPGAVGLYQFNVVLPDIPLYPGASFDDYVNATVYLNGESLPVPIGLPRSLYISIEK